MSKPASQPGKSSSQPREGGGGVGAVDSQAGGVSKAGQEVSTQLPQKPETPAIASAETKSPFIRSDDVTFESGEPSSVRVVARITGVDVEAKTITVTPEPPVLLAPEGVAKQVATTASASALSGAVAVEMERRLKKGADLVDVPVAPGQQPVKHCRTCGVDVKGFDAAHGCQKEDILVRLRSKGLHESLEPKVKFSGRYRLCLWRDAEGQYRVAEELVDEHGVIAAFNELDDPESWAYMGARLLDLVVDKFTP